MRGRIAWRPWKRALELYGSKQAKKFQEEEEEYDFLSDSASSSLVVAFIVEQWLWR